MRQLALLTGKVASRLQQMADPYTGSARQEDELFTKRLQLMLQCHDDLLIRLARRRVKIAERGIIPKLNT
ncbi:hypothetical protein GCM10027217_08460 [Pseudomaricurvus hydrocarbonicus]